MSEIKTKILEGTPFSITLEKIETKPGCWAYTNVKVYKEEKYIGEYTRNYSNGEKTFFPFTHKGKWYALYSKDYTATRIARLEDTFEDWCGDERNTFGFCPSSFYVPKAKYNKCYTFFRSKNESENKLEKHYIESFTWDNEDGYKEEVLEPLKDVEPNVMAIGCIESCEKYANFGFVSGCVWGDDSSWKLRYIDFSELENKIVRITEKFGYFELPNLPLKKCVIFSDYTGFDGKSIDLLTVKNYPYDFKEKE